MSLSVHTYPMMFRYEIKSNRNKISVIQFKNQETGKWGEVIVSSMVHFGCGPSTGRDPFEMLNEIMALVEELRTVLVVLDNAQKQMGRDYQPPLIPFKDEYLPEYLFHDQMRSAIIGLHGALWDRDQCGDCGGQGWTYIDLGGETEKETCDCASGAEYMLAKYDELVKILNKEMK